MPNRLPELVEGHGVVLRRWRVSDAEAVGQAVAESADHLRPWMEWLAHEPLELEQRRALIRDWEERWAAGGDVVMGVFRDARVAGGCGLHRRIGPRGLEIGYWIHPSFTRQGLATVAAELLTQAAFTVPDIDHVEIHHDRANRASRGIPEKLGFAFQGEAPARFDPPAGDGTDWIWRMDHEDWLARETATARP